MRTKLDVGCVSLREAWELQGQHVQLLAAAALRRSHLLMLWDLQARIKDPTHKREMWIAEN